MHHFRNKLTTRSPIVQLSTVQANRFSANEQSNQTSNSNNEQSTEADKVTVGNEIPVKLYAIQQTVTGHQNIESTTAIPRTTRLSFKTRIPSTARPFIATSLSRVPVTTQRIVWKSPQSQFFEDASKTKKRKEPLSSDYDDFTGLLGNLPEHSKVIIHSDGVIQCLDQGNFPHPVSCKKFISCAKMETGKVIGWEYTCPKNLSFDPVGGMCNWSADLGCDE